MKKLILIPALFGALNLAAINNTVNSSIKEELKVVKLEGVSLSEEHPNFVNVEVSVISGKLEVNDIDGSSEELKAIVEQELSSVSFDPACCVGERYLYQIRFERR